MLFTVRKSCPIWLNFSQNIDSIKIKKTLKNFDKPKGHFASRIFIELHAGHHPDVKVPDPDRLPVHQVIKAGKEVEGRNDFRQMNTNLVDEMQPD